MRYADLGSLEVVHPARPTYSSYADRQFTVYPLFGDTHLHTSFSMDAGAFGARLTPGDGFADFEIGDKGNLDGSEAKTPDMLKFEYTRSASKNGLVLEAKLGTNPYKFGLVSSSDAHTGLSAMEEENYFGKTAPRKLGPERMTKAVFDNSKTGVKIMERDVGASGHAAVWATANTREALWDAMERKETYAATGSRIIIRFFGGYDFVPEGTHNRGPAWVSYGSSARKHRCHRAAAPAYPTSARRRASTLSAHAAVRSTRRVSRSRQIEPYARTRRFPAAICTHVGIISAGATAS